MDPDVKAMLESNHTQLSERLKKIERSLHLSNDNCARLTKENSELKHLVAEQSDRFVKENSDLKQLVAKQNFEIQTLKSTVAANKLASDLALENHKTESARAIKTAVAKAVSAHKASIDELRIGLDDLEQYGRRKSVRIQNVRVVQGENDDKSQDKLLASVNQRLEPSGIKLVHEDLIRFHRSSALKDDKDVPGGKVSQVILKMRNWKLRAQFQGLNKLMKEYEDATKLPGCRVYHDLTKRRLALLNEARQLCQNGWFAYADVNSNLKLRKGDRFLSFNTRAELKKHINSLGFAEREAEPEAELLVAGDTEGAADVSDISDLHVSEAL